MDERCARRVSRSRQSPLPRAADRLPGLRAALPAAHRDERCRRGTATVVRRGRAACSATGRSWPIKGLGGYHLACDARNAAAVAALRERKFRKEKPFALMVRDLEVARARWPSSRRGRGAADRSAPGRSCSRPARAAAARTSRRTTASSALMLPYTPLHHLLFAAGAPDVLVMTSANRSSEPIAYEDDDALRAARRHRRCVPRRRAPDRAPRGRLGGPERGARSGDPASRAAATRPAPWPRCPPRGRSSPLGADLKNAVTLVVDGQAFVSQHIGDLDDYRGLPGVRGDHPRSARHVRRATVDDLLVVQ